MKRVYLTYDNLAKQDGAGAQLQRIFGVYSISMKLRIPYFHSKILETIEERAHNAESADDLMEFLDQVNRNFELPSVVLPSRYREIRVHNITVKRLAKIVLGAFLRREIILVRICLPFGILEKYPDWYEYAGKEIRRLKPHIESKPKNQVVVHIRYGYKPIAGANQGSAPRFLPLSYYPLALSELFKVENLDLSTPVLVQTDMPKENGRWRPFQEGRITELHKIGYEVSNNQFDFETIDLKNEYFSGFPNVTVKYCDPVIQTLEDMFTARYLLMSRSSFSYIAGIINPHKVYIPRQHGHAKMKRWNWDFSEDETPKIELLSGI